jgi:signal transduction histidine kinase
LHRNHKFASLKNVLTLNFILVATLPVLIVGLIGLHIFTTGMEREITDKNFLLAQSLVGEVERFLKEPMNILQQIKDVIGHDGMIAPHHITSYLSSVITNYQFFETLMILDYDGKVIHRVPYSDELFKLDMSGQEFFHKPRDCNCLYWSPTFISLQTNQPTLTLSLSVEQNVFVGYLNLEVLTSIIEKIVIGDQGRASIADRNGTIIAHRDTTLVAQRVNLPYFSMIRDRLSTREGNFQYWFRGVERLSSVAVVPQTRWYVEVTQPVEEAFAPIRRIRTILWAGTLVAMTLAVLIAVFILRKTLSPLAQLTVNAKHIAAGDYRLVSHEEHYHEVAELAQSFNAMVEAVKTREERIKSQNLLLEQAVWQKQHEMEGLFERLLRQEKLATIGHIAGSIAHELRNPLGAVKQSVFYLKRLHTRRQLDDAHSKVQEHLTLIEEEVNTSERIIADLLQMTRMNPIQREQTELRPIIVDAIRRCGLPERIKVTIEVQPDPLRLWADPAQLRQVLLNLFANAGQAMDGPGCITIRAKHLADEAVTVVEVADTGCGIAPEMIDKIFEPLYTTKTTGTGLGLSICKHIIEKHDGQITVTSEPARGTVVTIRLPQPEQKDNNNE